MREYPGSKRAVQIFVLQGYAHTVSFFASSAKRHERVSLSDSNLQDKAYRQPGKREGEAHTKIAGYQAYEKQSLR